MKSERKRIGNAKQMKPKYHLVWHRDGSAPLTELATPISFEKKKRQL